LLLLEQLIKPTKRLGLKTKWLGNVYTLLAVTVAFVLFRSESFSQALAILGNMFTGSLNIGAQSYLVSPMFITAFCAGVLGATPWIHAVRRMELDRTIKTVLSAASYVVAVLLLILCMLALSSATHNPFIYFRF